MAKRTTNKIEALEQELRQALINKQYEKAKEIQGKLDYINFGITKK